MLSLRLLLLCVVLLPSTFHSQVILNGDFENFNYCPNMSDLDAAPPWFAPSATPDYFNTCSSICEAGVPDNRVGTHVFPHSGIGYGGIICYYTSAPNPEIREYLAIPLNTSLDSGGVYTVSFYARKSNRQMYATQIGADFFDSFPSQTGNSNPYGFIPQIESNGVLTDTTWTLISSTYTASGNEQYFVIGNYRTNSQSTILSPPYLPPNCFNNTSAYYYVDDVLIEEQCGETYDLGIEMICPGDSLQIFGNYESSPGVYFDSLTTTNECDSILMRELQLHSLPVVSIDPIPKDTICIKSGSILLSGSPVGGAFSGPGVIGNTFDPLVADVGQHVLVYSYVDSNNCQGTDSLLLFVEDCLGTPDIEESSVHIYPNPSTGLFKLVGERFDYILRDLSGKLLFDGWCDSSVQIDLEEYSKGVYILQVTQNGNLTNHLLVVY